MDGPPERFGGGYRLLSAAVVPRPIAWVGTYAADGTPNLAPYSFHNVVAVDPPVLMFAPVGIGDDRKDTPTNVIDTGVCVVHVVTAELVEAMNATSATLSADADEFDHAGLTRVDGVTVAAPRVTEAAVAFECELHDTVEIGSSTLVLAEVVHAHVDDALLVDGKLDVTELDAVGRLAGGWYCHTRDRFEIERPP